MPLGNLNQTFEIAGHTDLMHTKDCARLRTDRRLNQGGVDVVCLWIDIYENGQGSAITHTVCGRDEGVADGDNFVTKPDSCRQ